MTHHDRRTQPRVEWTSEAVAAFGSREVRLHTHDLSVGGCCVETPWCPSTGERVGIVLQLDGEPVGAWAEVAWAMRRYGAPTESYLWGLRFVELDAGARTRLSAFVDHCLAVDMLDEMLRGVPHGDDEPVPAFGAGELEDVPTRIFSHSQIVASHVHGGAAPSPDSQPRAFFPVESASAFEGEATSEIDVEATLTSEAPHTRTVQVDLAGMYRGAAPMTAPTITATTTTAPTIAATPPTAGMQDAWDAPHPEPIGADGGWGAASFAPQSTSWDDDSAPIARAEFVIEPLAADPAPPREARRPTPAPIPDSGDPFWSGTRAPFPARTPSAWPSAAPTAAPVQASAGTPRHDPNAYAKATPFDAPDLDAPRFQDAIEMPADGDAFGHFDGFGQPTTAAAPAFDGPAFATAPAFATPSTFEPAPTHEAAPTYEPAPTFEAAPTYEPVPTYEPAPQFEAAPTYAPAPSFEPAPAFATAPAFAAPGRVAFEGDGFDGHFDTQAFAQQPVAPPPFAADPIESTQAFERPQSEPSRTFAAAPTSDIDASSSLDAPASLDAHAFDPSAFEPTALAAAPSTTATGEGPTVTRPRPGAGPAPITGPHPILETPPPPRPAPTPEITPLSADALLDLKRKRVEALLSSVPRRADANTAGDANNSKDEQANAAKKRRARPVSPDSGLLRLFDQALREIKQGE